MSSGMFYIIVILALIVSILIIRAIYRHYLEVKFNNDIQVVDNLVYYKKTLMSDGFRYILPGYKVYFEFNKGKLSQLEVRLKDKACLWIVRRSFDSNIFNTYCQNNEGSGISCNLLSSLYGISTSLGYWLQWLAKRVPNLSLETRNFVQP